MTLDLATQLCEVEKILGLEVKENGDVTMQFEVSLTMNTKGRVFDEPLAVGNQILEFIHELVVTRLRRLCWAMDDLKQGKIAKIEKRWSIGDPIDQASLESLAGLL